MKSATAVVTPAGLLVLALGCTQSPVRIDDLSPAASSTSILRSDRLQRMPASTAFDALETLASYMNRTTRQPAPRFILVLDGTRTSNLETLRAIQARDVFEIRVVGESQSLGNPGEVEIVVTTVAQHSRIG